jgi:predicted HTH transcriptional regulator
MRKTLDVTDRTIARYISDLKEFKIVDRVGPDKGGSWKVLI